MSYRDGEDDIQYLPYEEFTFRIEWIFAPHHVANTPNGTRVTVAYGFRDDLTVEKLAAINSRFKTNLKFADFRTKKEAISNVLKRATEEDLRANTFVNLLQDYTGESFNTCVLLGADSEHQNMHAARLEAT
ncbi:MAG: hypothetical protein L3J62_07385 [Gammaproteobacteria bacterium]|nr:hypothetical protein [Gammaproteobacteria bacterium]